MAPVVPSVATTRFGMIWPGIQLRSAALGRVVVDGYTVRKLGAVVFVTVTLTITAVALVGTPLDPVTCRVRVPPGLRVCAGLLVSLIRVGLIELKFLPVAVESVK